MAILEIKDLYEIMGIDRDDDGDDEDDVDDGDDGDDEDDVDGDDEDDVDDFYHFPDVFKNYIETELFHWRSRNRLRKRDRWVFWSRDDHEPERPQSFQHCTSEFIPEMLTDSQTVKRKIKLALQDVRLFSLGYPLLIQFWAPITTNEGRSLLTTQNQPFALSGIDGGLCRYRMMMKSEEYKFYVDGESEEDLGLVGRVFFYKLPVHTPNVKCNSSKEYPQYHRALGCNVGASLALPVFDPSDQSCVGVLEIVKTVDTEEDVSAFCYQHNIFCGLKDAGLKCSDVCDHSSELDMDKNEALTAAADEIQNVFEVVCKAHELHVAQLWVPCRLCGAVVDGEIFDGSCIKSAGSSISYWADINGLQFLEACESYHLRKGQGFVWRALLSHNLVLCTDVTKFSITEYPMAHYARDCKLGGCFAICLQSSCTGNDVYVLEFFLPGCNEDSGSLQHSLHKILATIKQSCKTLNPAFGKDWEALSIEDFHNSEIPQVASSPPRSKALENEGVMMYLDSSGHPSMDLINNGENFSSAEQSDLANIFSQGNDTMHLDPSSMDPINSGENVASAEQIDVSNTYSQGKDTVHLDLSSHPSMDPINYGKNVSSTEQINIANTHSEEKDTPKVLGRPKSKTGFSISSEDLLQHAGKKRIDAAKCLGISISTFKRVCREHDITRWPPRKLKNDNRSLPIESVQSVDREQILQSSSDLPYKQASSTVAHTKPCDTRMQDANSVTIKAKYGNGIARKFPLSLSSGLVELQQKLAKKLKLEAGMYDIKYKDEDNDSILIADNEDLQCYIDHCRSLGTTSVVILLEPILPNTH